MDSLYRGRYKALAVAIGLSAFAITAQAATTTLTYNYMATNLSGAFATPVATVQITDLSDLGISNPIAGATGGVQVNLSVQNLSQFSSGAAGTSVWISSYELNFPGTEEAFGYSSANFANVSGVPLAGGVEWEEGGATWGWSSFGQELNFSSTGITQGQSSVINLYNAVGRDDISVADLLGNPVLNGTNPTQPNAYSWIKIRGTGSATPALRGVAASGFWGASEVGGTGANQQYRLNVVALNPVPEPSQYALLGVGLGVLAFVVRRRQSALTSLS
jgi:hypothetical protein